MSNEVVNDFQYQHAPEKKNNTTLWIILGVALAVLLCPGSNRFGFWGIYGLRRD